MAEVRKRRPEGLMHRLSGVCSSFCGKAHNHDLPEFNELTRSFGEFINRCEELSKEVLDLKAQLAVTDASTRALVRRQDRMQALEVRHLTVKINKNLPDDEHFSVTCEEGGSDIVVSKSGEICIMEMVTAIVKCQTSGVGVCLSFTEAAPSDPKLEDLSPIVGNIEGLTGLLLPEARISGHIDHIAQLTSLRHLNLQGTQVGGSLESFMTMTQLIYFNVGGTKVTGCIDHLEPLVDLRELHLNKTKIHGGSIEKIWAMTKLTHLNLAHTQTGGEIKCLRTHTKLIYLNLQKTKIHGDIKELVTLTNLKELYLQDTTKGNEDIRGDVEYLASLKELRRLDLGQTRVSGNISTLVTLHELVYLDLSGTRICGGIEVLAPLRNLKNVYLCADDVRVNIEFSRPKLESQSPKVNSNKDIEKLTAITTQWQHRARALSNSPFSTKQQHKVAA